MTSTGSELMILCKKHSPCIESSCGRRTPDIKVLEKMRAEIGNEILIEKIEKMVKIIQAPEYECVTRIQLCPRFVPSCCYLEIASCVFEVAKEIHLGARVCECDD